MDNLLQDDAENRNFLKSAQIIWLAMIFTLIIYCIILIKANGNYILSEGEVLQPFYQLDLFMIFCIFSLIALIMSHLLPRLIFKNAKINAKSKQTYFSALVVRLALSEAVAINGLVLGFLSHQNQPFFIFAGVAVCNFLISYPNNDNIKKIVGEI